MEIIHTDITNGSREQINDKNFPQFVIDSVRTILETDDCNLLNLRSEMKLVAKSKKVDQAIQKMIQTNTQKKAEETELADTLNRIRENNRQRIEYLNQKLGI